MAVLDTEKRPKGLRMPSFAAMKNNLRSQSSAKKTMSEPRVKEETAPPQAPAFDFQFKDNDITTTTAATAPSSGSFSKISHFPPPPGPLPPVPTSSKNETSAEEPPVDRNPEGVIQTPGPVHPVTKPSIGTSPPEEEDPLDLYIPNPDSIDPLSDPDPDSGPDRNPDSAVPQQPVGLRGEEEQEGGDEEEDEEEAPLTPPDIVEVAAPLNKVHFECYQEHQTMPLSRNAWHSTPCMTCLKKDREIRFRCIFCCLRICSSCFEVLQECPNRSLGRLVETLSE